MAKNEFSAARIFGEEPEDNTSQQTEQPEKSEETEKKSEIKSDTVGVSFKAQAEKTHAQETAVPQEHAHKKEDISLSGNVPQNDDVPSSGAALQNDDAELWASFRRHDDASQEQTKKQKSAPIRERMHKHETAPIRGSMRKHEAAPEKKSPLNLLKQRKLIMILAAVLIFAVFTGFMLKQYSYSYLSHDDYGYATLSYVYWEDGMWGQDFSLSQLTHYLTEHYNRWGGRVLSFAQTILLFKAGTPVVQAFNALVLVGIFVLAFLLAQNAKKTKLLPASALFACATFGLIGQGVATSGLYWYSASILYMVPVLYIFLGCILMYTMMLGEAERTVSVSKLLMLPFACVLMFFGGFSLEHNGMYAVMAAAAIIIYATFRKRNPFVLVYGFPPFLSAVAGCRIMLMAVGNNSRKSMYADYYALPFGKQILTSAKTITQTLFRTSNMMFVILLALVCIGIALLLLKRKNNLFFKILLGCDALLALSSVAIANGNIATDKISLLLWIYLVFMAVTVSIWLFSTGKKQDALIWAIFFGSLVSQGACLISPIFPDRCLVPFVLTFTLIATRMFNEYISLCEELPRETAVKRVCAVLVPVVVIGAFGAGKIFIGFKENDAVQSFNERTLKVVAYEYENLNTSATQINLMKLKDDSYAGSTQPYGRDLIKDWMKIYYKLPPNLQYADFIYENYDEERLQELETELQEKESRYFKKD